MTEEFVTPDSRQGTSVFHDRTLMVWDMETGDAITNYIGDSVPGTCAISTDEVTIITCETSSRVHFLRWKGWINGRRIYKL